MRRIWMPVIALVSLLTAGTVSAAGPASWPTYLYGDTRDNAVQDGGSVSDSAHVAETWSLKLGGPINSSPMIENGIAYVGSWDGNVYAIDLGTHQILWKRFLGTQTTWLGPGGVSSPPAFAPDIGPNGAVLIGGGGQVQAGDKHLYFFALDATTGSVLWQTSIGDAELDSVFDGPLYLNGHVFIGTAGSGNGVTSNAPPRKGKVVELDGKTGVKLHSLSIAGSHDTGGAVWGSLSANSKGTRVFVATGDGDNPFTQPLTYAVVGLSPDTLKSVDHWQAPPNISAGDNDFGTTPTVITIGSRTLVGAGIKSGLYYMLDASHLKKGPMWSRQLGNGDLKSTSNAYDDICSSAYASGSAYPGGRTLFVAAPNARGGSKGKGGLFALNPTNGHTVWSVSLNGEPQEGAVTVYDNTVIVPIQKDFFNGVEGGEVDVRSVSDGHLIGSVTTAGTPFSAPVVVDGTIYFGTDDGTFHAVSVSS